MAESPTSSYTPETHRDGPTTILNARVPRSDHRAFHRLAEQRGLTASALVRDLIRAELGTEEERTA